MRTRTLDLTLADEAGRRAAIAGAAAVLRRGGLVAFPTETVYGLGANALDAEAVTRVFAAKGRPAWDPLIVHVTSRAMLSRVAASLPAAFERLAARFMPGPLTVLVPRAPAVPDAVTAGRATVAVRFPAHPVAHALIDVAGVPVAAPSANRFGHTSPTTAAHVLADLEGRVDLVLDAGPASVGVESTVVDLSQTPALILRPGGVSREALAEVLGPVDVFRRPLVEQPPEALPSPGAGIRHYAPRARVVTVEDPSVLGDTVRDFAADGLRVGVLLPGDLPGGAARALPASVEVFPWGRWGDWVSLASTLFAGLRRLDAAGLDVIACPLPPSEGLGLALRDRLEKAARPEPGPAPAMR
jgi:L-threonylcarbamoyladenylate synthase